MPRRRTPLGLMQTVGSGDFWWNLRADVVAKRIVGDTKQGVKDGPEHGEVELRE